MMVHTFDVYGTLSCSFIFGSSSWLTIASNIFSSCCCTSCFVRWCFFLLYSSGIFIFLSKSYYDLFNYFAVYMASFRPALYDILFLVFLGWY